jgi:hypothetical protein
VRLQAEIDEWNRQLAEQAAWQEEEPNRTRAITYPLPDMIEGRKS